MIYWSTIQADFEVLLDIQVLPAARSYGINVIWFKFKQICPSKNSPSAKYWEIKDHNELHCTFIKTNEDNLVNVRSLIWIMPGLLVVL